MVVPFLNMNNLIIIIHFDEYIFPPDCFLLKHSELQSPLMKQLHNKRFSVAFGEDCWFDSRSVLITESIWSDLQKEVLHQKPGPL